jgi:hypothetical protein
VFRFDFSIVHSIRCSIPFTIRPSQYSHRSQWPKKRVHCDPKKAQSSLLKYIRASPKPHTTSRLEPPCPSKLQAPSIPPRGALPRHTQSGNSPKLHPGHVPRKQPVEHFRQAIAERNRTARPLALSDDPSQRKTRRVCCRQLCARRLNS